MQSGISTVQRAAFGAVAAIFLAVAAGASDEPPEGVTQLLGRNAIPAISNPTFVTASEATMPDDAWVLGVSIDGQARAYSLNLLNHHEIVNDEIADRTIAAVW